MEQGSWNGSYNWMYEQVMHELEQFGNDYERDQMSLDMEHTDWQNEIDVVTWCREAGYEAEYDDANEVVRVWKR